MRSERKKKEKEMDPRGTLERAGELSPETEF